MRIFLVVVAFILLSGANAISVELVSEDFDDKVYNPPLTFYNITGYNQNIIYNSTDALGGKGYSLKWDHAAGRFAGIGILSGMETYVDEGLYLRYWVKYSADYYFPEDEGHFDNLKMFKLGEPGAPTSSSYDIEFIYKDTGGGGPSSLQLFWIKADGSVGGTGVGVASLGSTLSKNEWHKIEIFIRLAATSEVHVQVDDNDIIHETNAEIKLPASSYAGTTHFMSLRADDSPSAGHGEWYSDNITIIHDEGDLCNLEPPEPSVITISIPRDFQFVDE